MSTRIGAMVLVLLGACVVEQAGDEVGQATSAAITPVTWTNLVGVSAVGSDLTKSSGEREWNAGATSVERVSRDGYLEFTTGENTTNKMAGLGGFYSDPGDYIAFAIHLQFNGIVAIRENRHLRASLGPYAAGDVFRVQLADGIMTYWQNGALLYTSRTTPTYALAADTSLKTPGATILDAVIETDMFWTGVVGAAADGRDLTKVPSGPGWSSGARSIKSLGVDGYVEFTTSENTTAKMAGLSSDDSNTSYEDIDFAIYLKADGTVAVREAGLHRGIFGAYAPGDVFRVQAAGGVVTYARNGTVFYTSSGTPAFPLLLDTSLRSVGATIQDARLARTRSTAVTARTSSMGTRAAKPSSTTTGSPRRWTAAGGPPTTRSHRRSTPSSPAS